MKPSHETAQKTVVVTGATSGIGLGIAKELARKGDLVIAVGRSEANIRKAENEILAETAHARVQFFLADLSTQNQVRNLGQNIRDFLQSQSANGLHALINNAGTVANWYTATEDGYELQFAVNHLAPFLLTHIFLPQLKNVPGSRVITVSSNSHRGMRML